MCNFGCGSKANRICWAFFFMVLFIGPLSILIAYRGLFTFECTSSVMECIEKVKDIAGPKLFKPIPAITPGEHADNAEEIEMDEATKEALQRVLLGCKDDIVESCNVAGNFRVLLYGLILLPNLAWIPCFYFCCCSSYFANKGGAPASPSKSRQARRKEERDEGKKDK
mmetsp:Transcript_7415/g.16101  ORF Transcript_7415/g.16101 Transcript_7415/m.16101 type:complete len:168 (+) Transcript_7415:62-565(+)